MEQKIRELICELYHCDYKGIITIKQLNPIGYQIYIPLSADEKPFSLAIEAEGDSFYKELKKLLREASLNIIENYTLKLTY